MGPVTAMQRKNGEIESALRSHSAAVEMICASCESHRRHMAVLLELPPVRPQDAATSQV
jgi:hypothetical protein